MSNAQDTIKQITLRAIALPLKAAVSDAKVLTGKQKSLSEVALLIAEIETEQGYSGIGFTYTLRTGGPAQYAFAKEVAPLLIGEDPNDISRLWSKLSWAGASIGRGGLSAQSIAAFDTALWDLKAKRAQLPLSKLLGAHRDAVPCYNTSGGYLQASTEEVIAKAEASLARGISGIKIKVGHPDSAKDIERVTSLRKHFGDQTPLMVDVNQQWSRTTAMRMGRALDDFGLEWIEEPLDAYDVVGHKQLADALVTPVGTGEMLVSAAEVQRYIEAEAVDVLMHDAPRVGGITPFLKAASAAEQKGMTMAPHFVMEVHLHLAAAYEHQAWVEHFEWLEPAFEERFEIKGGCMIVPNRPGLGLTPHEQLTQWTQAAEIIR